MDENFEPKERIARLEKRLARMEEENNTLREENNTLRERNYANEGANNALVDMYNTLGKEDNCGERLHTTEEDERGLDMVLEAYEEKRRYYEEKLVKPNEEMEELGKMLDNSGKKMEERETYRKLVDLLVEEVTNFEAECNVLKEENELLKEMRKASKDGNYKERVLEFIRKLEEKESSRADTMGGQPQIPQATSSGTVERDDASSDDANGGGCVVSKEGVVLTQEAWKVIDENWEELKDAVYKIKVRKEKTPYVRLPMEGWKVLDKYFDELVKLFHI